MKALKVLGYVMLIACVGYLILAIASPSNLQFERKITINTTVQTVFAQVNCFDKWPSWSPWDAMDKSNENEYSENPCGMGAWNTWRGRKTGVGKQTILDVKENEYIKTGLVFGKDPRMQISEWYFRADGGQCEVTWNYTGNKTQLLVRPMNLVGRYLLSKTFENGLNSLKSIAEAADPLQFAYEVSEKSLNDFKVLTIEGEIPNGELSSFLESSFQRLRDFANKNGVNQVGPPSALYYSWTDSVTHLAAAIGVDMEIPSKGDIKLITLSWDRVLKTDHTGSYRSIADAHYFMQSYMQDNGLVQDGPFFEVYSVNHENEPDTSKWQTGISYPVKNSK